MEEIRLIDANAYKEYLDEKWIPANHDAIDAQPTIEAIPVEWIEKQSNRIKMSAETVYDIVYAKQLLRLIKQWRMENNDHKSGKDDKSSNR